MSNEKNYFSLPIRNGSFLELLTDEQNGKLFKAIYKYEIENDVADLDFGKDEILKKVFDIFKEGLDFSEEQRLKKSEINRLNVSKRYANEEQKKEIKERITFLTGTTNTLQDYIKLYGDIRTNTTENGCIHKEKNRIEKNRIEKNRKEKKVNLDDLPF